MPKEQGHTQSQGSSPPLGEVGCGGGGTFSGHLEVEIGQGGDQVMQSPRRARGAIMVLWGLLLLMPMALWLWFFCA